MLFWPSSRITRRTAAYVSVAAIGTYPVPLWASQNPDESEPMRGATLVRLSHKHQTVRIRIPVVLEALRRAPAHAGALFNRPQQQCPGVGSDRSAIEAGDQPATTDPRKLKLGWRTMCRQEAASVCGLKLLSQQHFTPSRAASCSPPPSWLLAFTLPPFPFQRCSTGRAASDLLDVSIDA